MKTMTCKQMGGPCDAAFSGAKADEVIKAQDQHLKDAVAAGDETHRAALEQMHARWKNPVRGMGWYRQTKKDFAALPVDPPSDPGSTSVHRDATTGLTR